MHTILRAVLLGVGCVAGLPREGQAQRQVKHLNSFAAAYGQAHNGFSRTTTYYRLGYSRFLSDKTRFDVALRREGGTLPPGPAEPGTPPGTPLEPRYYACDLALGVAPRLFHVGEVLYVHLTTQLHVRYDRISQSEQVVQGISTGPGIGASADLYLADWVSLSGQAGQQFMFFDSPLGRWPQYYGGGLSIHFR